MITLLDKQGREIQEQDKIMERIEEFYSELFDSDQAATIQTDPKEVPPIMAWEVEAALKKMKNVKEAGKDQVNIETLIISCPQRRSSIAQLDPPFLRCRLCLVSPRNVYSWS